MVIAKSAIATLFVVALIAIANAEEEQEYDCFWGDTQTHDGGGDWAVTLKCPKGEFDIKKATAADPLTMNMKWRDGSKDFKFCALPSNSFHQPWTVVAKENGRNKNVQINQGMKYYTNQSPVELAERFRPVNCATSNNKELQVTIRPDDNYWSHAFTYVIYPL